MLLHRLALVGVTAGLLGCGARSSLDGDREDGTSGAGGSTTTTTATTSTTSSGGACVLAQSGADVAMPPVAGFHERRPALVALDVGNAVVAFGLEPLVATEPPQLPLADVIFAPWGPWPPALDSPHQLSASGGASFAIAGSGNTFSLSFLDEGLTVAVDADPMGTVTAEGKWPFQGSMLGIASTAGVVLAAFVSGAEEATTASIERVNPEGPYSRNYGCSKIPLAGDAIAFGSGFLWASSVNPEQHSCPAAPLPPKKLVVAPIPTGGDSPVFQGALDNGTFSELAEPPSRLRLAPRASGAWLLWQGSAGSAIQAQRLDASAKPDLAPFDVVSAAQEGFAIAPYGAGLAIAWIASSGPDARLAIATFDDAGAQIGTAELSLAGSSVITGPLSLLTEKDALVVAWSEEAAGMPARVHVARFDGCAGQ